MSDARTPGDTPEPGAPDTGPEDARPEGAQSVAAPAKDPMKSFRGVQAGTLVIEAIVVALALPVVAQLGAGLTSLQGWAVGGIAVAFLLCSGLLRWSGTIWVVLALHGGLLAFVVAVPWVAVIGVLFLAVWLWMMWLRRDVAIRMAQGRLPGQQA